MTHVKLIGETLGATEIDIDLKQSLSHADLTVLLRALGI